nr:hypothetical protein [uncultured Aminipila sp.]
MSLSITGYRNTLLSTSVTQKSSQLSSKEKWELTDSLKDKITQLAQEDAKDAIYMGKQYKSLLKNEVAKVSPDRAAAMAKATSMMNSNENIESYKEMREADERLLCMLFHLPYKAKFETGALGTGAHIFDENNDEIATFTPGVGWQTCSSKAEQTVYDSMKFAYYDAYHEARIALKAGEKPPTSQTLNLQA